MTIGRMILALLFVSAVAVGVTIFFGGFVDSPTYSNATTGYNQTAFVEVAKDTQDMAVEMNETISQSEFTGIAAIDLPLTMVVGGFNTLKLALKSVDIFDQLFYALIEGAGLPLGWFLPYVTTAIAVIFILGLASILLRYDILGGSRY